MSWWSATFAPYSYCHTGLLQSSGLLVVTWRDARWWAQTALSRVGRADGLLVQRVAGVVLSKW